MAAKKKPVKKPTPTKAANRKAVTAKKALSKKKPAARKATKPAAKLAKGHAAKKATAAKPAPKKKATVKKTASKSPARKTPPKKAAAKAAGVKRQAARRPARDQRQAADTPSLASRRFRTDSAGQSGDLQGLSRTPQSDSESVDELIDEGNAFEASAVSGVEAADDADEEEVHTHEELADDIPDEYFNKE